MAGKASAWSGLWFVLDLFNISCGLVGDLQEDGVAEWIRLCAVAEAPVPGEATEAEARGVAVCLANIDGRLAALDNWCPHRRGPLGQGWVEGGSVVCPWHAWAFNAVTGVAEPPERAKVDVFPIKIEGEDVLVQLG